MIRKSAALFFFISAFIIKFEAQDSISCKPSNLFGLYSGFSDRVTLDEAMFPNTDFTGINVPVFVNYRYNGSKTRQQCSFFFDKQNLNSSNSNITNELTITNTNAILEYSYCRYLFEIPRYRIQCFIGGKFQSLLNYREYNDFPYYQNELMCEQFNSIGFDWIIEKKFQKNNDFVSLDFSIPVVTFSLVNNVYNQWVNDVSQNIQITNQTKIGFNDLWEIIRKGQFISYNKLFECQANISYTKFINKHLGIECTYRLHYYSFAQYTNTLYAKNFDTQFLFGFIIKK